VHYGSAGAGGLTHVAMELLRERIGHPMLVHVPCRSASAVLAELAANRFGMMFARLPVAAPFLQAGQLRGVLSTGPTRIPGLATAGSRAWPTSAFRTGSAFSRRAARRQA
jgi:tripartite-type tricarboxylate transporter receptor subunit TctC